jgi:hypothetical protein
MGEMLMGYYIVNWDGPAQKAVRVQFHRRPPWPRHLIYRLMGWRWFALTE